MAAKHCPNKRPRDLESALSTLFSTVHKADWNTSTRQNAVRDVRNAVSNYCMLWNIRQHTAPTAPSFNEWHDVSRLIPANRVFNTDDTQFVLTKDNDIAIVPADMCDEHIRAMTGCAVRRVRRGW